MEVPTSESELLQSLLHDQGATGLEIRDSHTLPMPRVRAPQRGCAMVIAFFDNRLNAQSASRRVAQAHPHAPHRLQPVPLVDWSNRWKRRIRSNQVGRVWVGPPWEAPPKGFRGVSVRIEPKMAFGTGDHPTTVLCLDALDEYLSAHPRSSVLDVGTGSGVLAIAAEKLGAKRVVAVDNDPSCLLAARENCRANRVHRVRVSATTLNQLRGCFDLVVANILANTLVDLAPLLRRKVRDRLVLAGLLVHQRKALEAAYRRCGLGPCDARRRGEWLRLDFQPR